jgi:hypothetical protein
MNFKFFFMPYFGTTGAIEIGESGILIPMAEVKNSGSMGIYRPFRHPGEGRIWEKSASRNRNSQIGVHNLS